jgi:2-polyprenyl-3-methyl-5-hydroxy-6-metoxy-1,4-benzoquinol methylase
MEKQITQQNPWSRNSHFEWANKDSIRRIYNQRFLFFYRILKREIQEKGRIKLLDYGCGDGYWPFQFSQVSKIPVVRVDYNPLQLKRCHECISDQTFIEADLNEKNIKLEKYDVGFCCQVIEHVQDDVT